MNIGLIDVDGNGLKRKRKGRTQYPNYALCKIAAYHKGNGDAVSWYVPFIEKYDIVYCSKVFSFSLDFNDCINSDKIVRGGTGYDISSKLPDYIERVTPDFSIYDGVPKNVSYGFLTRGCINHCPWCVVPEKEGNVRPYLNIDEVAQGKKNVILMDNNFLAAGDYAMQQMQKIIDKGYRVDFNQANDARLVNKENAKMLSKIKWMHNRIRFSADTKEQIESVDNAVELIRAAGFNGEFFIYTMLHGTFEECYWRIDHFRENVIDRRYGKNTPATYPYAQPYIDPHDSRKEIPMWQKDMARWCNRKELLCSTRFEDYNPRGNFLCIEYFKKYWDYFKNKKI